MGTNQLRDQAEELHQALNGLIQRYQFRNRNEICCFDVSVSQSYALEILEARGTLGVGELSRAMYLSISTLSRVLDQLERKGYVRRGPDARDQRARQVSLTVKGKRLLARVQEASLTQGMALLQQIPASSRRSVILTLKQLAQAIDTWRSCCVPAARKLHRVKH